MDTSLTGKTGSYKLTPEFYAVVDNNPPKPENVNSEKKDNEESKPDGGHVNEAFDGKHTNSRNSVQLNVPHDHQFSDKPYRGMGKEELLYHSSKPLWRRLRYVCMCIVLLGWLALIITVVALILIYPRCRTPSNQDWWQKTLIYRIYVRSFQDSDNDGIGDLAGVTQRLDYLSYMGVGAISLSPIYRLKPNAQTDFDVFDHRSISNVYGSMDSFRTLLNETHKRGMHLILDFIPNLTSDVHPWFQESKSSNLRNNTKRNYYVWSEGNEVPNNWKSVINGSAWTRDATRNEYYLHQFNSDQPELNLRSAEVQDELQKILQFWLDEGVDGFYIRDSAYMFEDYDLRNEPPSNQSGATPDEYAYYDHIYTYGLPEVHDMLARWRTFLDEYGNKTNSYKLLYADIDGTTQTVLDYYGKFNRDGVDFPLNRFCLHIRPGDSGSAIKQLVSRWMSNMPAGRWANWMGGDTTVNRLHGRVGSNMTRNFLMLTTLLPGTPFLYYGDEIDMVDSPMMASSQMHMKQRMRAPMQWDNSTYAGFIDEAKCTGTCNPWMSLNADAQTNNVMSQNSTFHSMMHLFKNLTKLRDKPSFQYGDYFEAMTDNDVFSFVREFDGSNGYLVVLNFAEREVEKSFVGSHDTIPGSASVELTTANGVSVSVGDSVSLNNLKLGPLQGIVVSWAYVAKEL